MSISRARWRRSTRYATVEESVLAEFSNSLFERIKSTNFVISNSVYHNYLTALMVCLNSRGGDPLVVHFQADQSLLL